MLLLFILEFLWFLSTQRTSLEMFGIFSLVSDECNYALGDGVSAFKRIHMGHSYAIVFVSALANPTEQNEINNNDDDDGRKKRTSYNGNRQ